MRHELHANRAIFLSLKQDIDSAFRIHFVFSRMQAMLAFKMEDN